MVARRGDARRTLRHARQGWTRHGSMSLSPRARGTTRGTDRRGSGYRRRRRRRRVAASVPRRAAACTTTLLAVAAIRDAALTLLARDADVEDDTRTRTVVERAERALYADAAGARRWIRDRVGEKSRRRRVVEGARPPFATTLLPSFVDRAAFFRCIVGGALAFARGERSPRSPGSRSRDTSSTPIVARRRRSTPRRRLFWFRAPRRRFVWRRRSTRCSRRRV